MGALSVQCMCVQQMRGCVCCCAHVAACIAMIYCGSLLVHGGRCGPQRIRIEKTAMEVSHMCVYTCVAHGHAVWCIMRMCVPSLHA